MAIDVGTAIGYLDLDTSGFENGFKTALSDLKIFQDNSASIGDKMSALGSSFTSAGKSLTTGVTLPLVGAGAAIVKTASDFEASMSGVKAISGATSEEFESLRNEAIELGASTAFSSQEVAQAMTEMAKAGWSTQQILDGMGGVLDAAASSGESLGTVSTIVADAISGFGLAAADSTRVADLLAQSANAGTIDIADLGESFKYAAPVAQAYGYNIEDVTTAITAMSTAGIKGSQAGTSLRTALLNMSSPTKTVAEAMEMLNISTTDSEGNMIPLKDLIDDMREGMSKYSQEEQIMIASNLAGKNAVSGLLAVLNLTQEEYDAISESMYNSAGVADETARVMQNNLSNRIEQLGGALESLAIKLGDLLIPKIQSFVEWLTNVVDKFTNLDTGIQDFILKFAGIAAAIGPVLLVLGNLFTSLSKISGIVKAVPQVIGTLGGVFKGLAAAIGGISAPVVAIIAAIGLLVAAFKHLWDTNEEFRRNVTNTWNIIKQQFQEFGQGIVDRLNEMGFDFENITDVIKTVWEKFCNFLAPIFEGVFNQISEALGTTFDVLLSLFDVFSGLFTGDWSKAWEGIKQIFVSLWDFLVNTIENILNTILGIFGTSLNEIQEKWDNAWKSVGEFFVNTWESMKNGIKTAISNIGDKIKNFASSIVTWFKELPSKMLDIGKNIVTGIWDGISGAASWLWDKISGFGSDIIGWFRDIFDINSPSKVMKSQGNFLMLGLAEGMNDSLGVVKSQIGVVADTINSTLDNVFDTARVLNVSADLDTNGISSSVKRLGSSDSRTSQVQNQYNFTYNSPKAVTPTVASKLLKQSAQQLALDF